MRRIISESPSRTAGAVFHICLIDQMAVANLREVSALDDESGSSCLHLLAASITGFDLVLPKQDRYFVVLFRTGA
jgi:hypothetical protein